MEGMNGDRLVKRVFEEEVRQTQRKTTKALE